MYSWRDLLPAAPLKMTSSILEPRRLLSDISPSTQRIRVGDVALAAAVRPDDGRDAVAEGNMRFIGKDLKP